MDPFSVGLVALVAGSAAATFVSQTRQRRRRWQDAAAACGVTEVEGWGLFPWSGIRGRTGSLEVRIANYSRGKHDRGTYVAVSGAACAAVGLTLSREGLNTAVRKAFGTQEIVTGDPEVDAAFFVRGPEGPVRAAAVAGLHRIGSVNAVLPLREAADRWGQRTFVRAADEAVAAIQQRLAGATPGQVSLAAADKGGLSLAEEPGRVSLAGEHEGRLSVADEPPED